MEAVGISTDDVWTLCMLLDADKNGTIDLDEFVAGCMQLHGPAKSLQIAKMSFENKLTRQAIRNLGQETLDIKTQLETISKFFSSASPVDLAEDPLEGGAVFVPVHPPSSEGIRCRSGEDLSIRQYEPSKNCFFGTGLVLFGSLVGHSLRLNTRDPGVIVVLTLPEREDLRALSVQVAEFRLHVENQLAEVVRLLENSKLKDSAASAQMSQTPSSSRCGAFRSEPPVSAGGSFRNSLLMPGRKTIRRRQTGSDPPMDSIEEAEEEVLLQRRSIGACHAVRFNVRISGSGGEKTKTRKTELLGPNGAQQSSVQLAWWVGSRHSFVRKSTVAHRQRAQSAWVEGQAQKLRSVRVSMHLMPQPSMERGWSEGDGRENPCGLEPRQRSLKYYANKIVSSGAFAYTITFFILLNAPSRNGADVARPCHEVILLGIEVDYSASVGQFDIPDWCWDFWFGEDGCPLNGTKAGCHLELLRVPDHHRLRGGPELDRVVFSSVTSGEDVALDFVTTAHRCSQGPGERGAAKAGLPSNAISSNLNTGQLRLVRSIRLARALRSMRVMRLFRYVSALRTLVLSIISEPILKMYWSEVPESSLPWRLAEAITGGVSWDDAVWPLRDVSMLALALVIFYVVIAVFAVLNDTWPKADAARCSSAHEVASGSPDDISGSRERLDVSCRGPFVRRNF
ncbi:unnamed protein product [Durusdinium trenchii]|uniref:EF-hand domain-containing protein n=1 Tax=Durusdinium trenchii TaxID=1381693 RepID=A0ABP0S4R5_9DINO